MYILVFNIIAILFLSFAAILPVILGSGMAADFWRMAWPMGLIVILALVAMNVYFLVNRRLFTFLKKEDWPALAEYLGKKIFKDGKFVSRDIRLLLYSYIVTGDIKSAAMLEERVAAAKPDLLEKYALLFGAARMLGGSDQVNALSSVGFFKDRLDKGAVADSEWLRWYYGFALSLAGLYEEARAVFGELTSGAKDGIVTGLSSFFLAEVLGGRSGGFAAGENTGSRDMAEEGALRVRRELKSLDIWNTRAAKITTEVYGAIIRKNIGEAGEWIFKGCM